MSKEKERGVKERPIIFSGEMVRAILEGRKTAAQAFTVTKNTRTADKVRYCNNGRCTKSATWIAHHEPILLLACDDCKDDDNAAAFGLAFRKL